jgi:hypothetical protein
MNPMKKTVLVLAGAPLLAALLTGLPHPMTVADAAEGVKETNPAQVDATVGAEASSAPAWLAFDRDWQKTLDPFDYAQVAQAAQDGQGNGGGDVFANADEAARQSSNPLGGDFMVLLNQWNVDFLQGDITAKTRNVSTHIFQPVVPIGLGGDWIVVTRPTLPIVYDAELPTGPNQFDNESGFGDIILFSLVGTSTSTDFLGGGDRVLAGGFTSMFPTGSKEFTADQYSLGPAGVAAFIGKDYIFGALGQHWWDVAEDKDNAPDVNKSNIQAFYFMNFPGGWQVGGAPQIEVDWEADSGDKWAVPVGLGLQKTQIMFGKLPVKFGVEAQHYLVDRNTFGNEWRIQFTIAPIIPNFIGNLIKGCPLMSVGGC